MLGGVVFGHEQMQAAIQAINELAEEAGKPAWDWKAPAKDEALIARVAELPRRTCARRSRIKQKQARNTRLDEIRKARAREAGRPSGSRRRAARRERGEGHLLQPRVEDRAQPDPRRRAAHRRPRHAHRAPDHHARRRAAAHPRLGAVHARRDAGAGHRDARHRPRRADHRRAGGRVPRALHVPLQHAAVRHRRDRPHRLHQAPRDRPRPPRQARAGRPAAARRRSSATRCASSPRSPNRTAPRRWPRCAAAASR